MTLDVLYQITIRLLLLGGLGLIAGFFTHAWIGLAGLALFGIGVILTVCLVLAGLWS